MLFFPFILSFQIYLLYFKNSLTPEPLRIAPARVRVGVGVRVRVRVCVCVCLFWLSINFGIKFRSTGLISWDTCIAVYFNLYVSDTF